MGKKMTVNLKEQSDWKIPKRKNEHYQNLLKQEKLIWTELRDKIKSSESYYLNEYGLIISESRKTANKAKATYLFAILDGYKTEENKQFYAWMRKDKKGIFCGIQFGSRQEFDYIVSKEMPKKESLL